MLRGALHLLFHRAWLLNKCHICCRMACGTVGFCLQEAPGMVYLPVVTRTGPSPHASCKAGHVL